MKRAARKVGVDDQEFSAPGRRSVNQHRQVVVKGARPDQRITTDRLAIMVAGRVPVLPRVRRQPGLYQGQRLRRAVVVDLLEVDDVRRAGRKKSFKPLLEDGVPGRVIEYVVGGDSKIIRLFAYDRYVRFRRKVPLIKRVAEDFAGVGKLIAIGCIPQDNPYIRSEEQWILPVGRSIASYGDFKHRRGDAWCGPKADIMVSHRRGPALVTKRPHPVPKPPLQLRADPADR